MEFAYIVAIVESVLEEISLWCKYTGNARYDLETDGIFIAHRSRFALLTIILAGLALAFPAAAALVIIYYLGFAIVFGGFARILDGVTNRLDRKWVRGFISGTGVLNVIMCRFGAGLLH